MPPLCLGSEVAAKGGNFASSFSFVVDTHCRASILIYLFFGLVCGLEYNVNLSYIFFRQNDTVKLDFDNFVRLFEEYYLSDDPGALGNFINGKLTYDEEESEDEDPGALVRREKKATLGFPRNRVR